MWHHAFIFCRFSTISRSKLLKHKTLQKSIILLYRPPISFLCSLLFSGALTCFIWVFLGHYEHWSVCFVLIYRDTQRDNEQRQDTHNESQRAFLTRRQISEHDESHERRESPEVLTHFCDFFRTHIQTTHIHICVCVCVVELGDHNGRWVHAVQPQRALAAAPALPDGVHGILWGVQPTAARKRQTHVPHGQSRHTHPHIHTRASHTRVIKSSASNFFFLRHLIDQKWP